ncbi:hypothetical protein B0H13DRAFT_2338926 [Mycena leptocephala]|nr:hypothetical protein B0H13DRAFT_2338926 [Mycena leptocephala]
MASGSDGAFEHAWAGVCRFAPLSVVVCRFVTVSVRVYRGLRVYMWLRQTCRICGARMHFQMYLLFGALFSPLLSPLSRALHSILLILARYSLAREIDFPLSGTTLRRDLCPLGKPLGLVVPPTSAAPAPAISSTATPGYKAYEHCVLRLPIPLSLLQTTCFLGSHQARKKGFKSTVPASNADLKPLLAEPPLLLVTLKPAARSPNSSKSSLAWHPQQPILGGTARNAVEKYICCWVMALT